MASHMNIDVQKRVKYQKGMNFSKKLTKGVMIIDESDDLMYEQPEEFFEQTKAKNL